MVQPGLSPPLQSNNRPKHRGQIGEEKGVPDSHDEQIFKTTEVSYTLGDALWNFWFSS